MCLAMQLGNQPNLMFPQVLATLLVFYTAHWQKYCSGTHKIGRVDVIEAQWGVVVIHVVSALLGTDFWEYQLPVTGLTLKTYVITGGAAIACMVCHLNLRSIFVEGGKGKRGSTLADTSVLSPVPPVLFVVALAYSISKKSVSNVLENHPCLYLLTFGVLMAKMTNKLLVATLAKSPMTFWDSGMTGPLLLFFNQYCEFFLDEYIVLWISFIYCTVDLLLYFCLVCKDMCDYLNVNCFKVEIPKRLKTEKTNNGVSSKNNSEGDAQEENRPY